MWITKIKHFYVRRDDEIERSMRKEKKMDSNVLKWKANNCHAIDRTLYACFCRQCEVSAMRSMPRAYEPRCASITRDNFHHQQEKKNSNWKCGHRLMWSMTTKSISIRQMRVVEALKIVLRKQTRHSSTISRSSFNWSRCGLRAKEFALI